MKKIFAIVTMLGLLSFGCSENNSIVNPTDNYTEDISLAKKGVIADDDGLTFSKEIDGKKGGKIDVRTTIEGGSEGSYKVQASLKISKGSFDGKIMIWLKFDPDEPKVEFGPEMNEFGMDEFKKAFKLSLKYENKWFSDDKKEGKLKFVYFKDDGTIEDVKSSKVGFSKKNKNWIFVKNARLEHFSRYGFTK